MSREASTRAGAGAEGAPGREPGSAAGRASGRPAARPRPKSSAGGAPSLARRRLRLVLVLLALAGVITGIALTAKIRREKRLPLGDQAIIRVQAERKHLDPALIAAVIYTESKFVPRESSAGAQGLMQVMPATAGFLARRSGGIGFTVADLGRASVNIAYGSYYLRYLLNRYGGDKLAALAAYNAGITAVNRWIGRAHAEGRSLAIADIGYPETRAYVRNVLHAEAVYHADYPIALGGG